MSLRVLVYLILGTLIAGPAFAVDLETKHVCGWFDNPTPGNVEFTDNSGEWEFSRQGGDEEPTGDYWPTFRQNEDGTSTDQWIHTNGGSYGFGCACMDITYKKGTRTVVSAAHPKTLMLKQCWQDKHLEQKYHQPR